MRVGTGETLRHDDLIDVVGGAADAEPGARMSRHVPKGRGFEACNLMDLLKSRDSA